MNPIEQRATSYDVTGLANAPQQKRSQELSLRILGAAEHLLKRDGLENFTIAAVATEAGVSVGGIYGRFQNRDELIAAIHSQMLSRIQDHLETEMKRPFSDASSVVTAFVTELVNVFAPLGGLLTMVGRRGKPRTLNRVERDLRGAFATALEPFMQEVRHRDPELAIRLTVHLVLASLTREVSSSADDTDRRMAWEVLQAELPRVALSTLMIRG